MYESESQNNYARKNESTLYNFIYKNFYMYNVICNEGKGCSYPVLFIDGI